MTLNDLVQYALIIALVVAAFADRSAHRRYTRDRDAQYASLLASLKRIEAMLNRRSHER